MFWCKQETVEEKRSAVRRFVTYIATLYAVGGSILLIAALWINALDSENLQIAKDVYFTVFPVATGVITYWFASRKPSTENSTTPPASGITPTTEEAK